MRFSPPNKEVSTWGINIPLYGFSNITRNYTISRDFTYSPVLKDKFISHGFRGVRRPRSVMNHQISQYIAHFNTIRSLHPTCYRVFAKFVSEKLDASELHDLKRNGRRGHYAATKTLENDDNRPVLNVSHSFTARKPRRRVGLPSQF